MRKTIFLVAILVASFGMEGKAARKQSLYNEASADDNPGEVLYKSHCAVCHDGGVAKAPDRHMLSMMSPGSIIRALETGVMKAQGSGLEPAQRELLVEHLSGQSLLTSTQTRLPPACSKEEARFEFNATPGGSLWGVNNKNHRHFGADVTRITTDNISRLKLKWAFAYPGAVRARSQPALAGGALFVGSQDGTVYSLSQSSGCLRWKFSASAEVRTAIVIEPWQGDSAAEPLAFFGDMIGNVYAVNAVTGELVWRDRPDDHPSLTITAAPAFFDGRLYVSLSSLEVTTAGDPNYACCTFQGGVAIYQARSGEKIDLIRTIEKPPEIVGKNALGTSQLAPSGSPIWNTPAIDAKRRRIYVGTGENYMSPANHTSDAIIAMDMDEYSMQWVRQATVGDAWNIGCETPDRVNCPEEDGPDYDFGAATILAQDSLGRERVLAGQKSGEVFALDPDNGGDVVWRLKLGRGGIQGGVHFGMALDGDVLYVPMSDFDGGDRWPGTPFPGVFAVDITQGRVLWYNRWPNTCNEKPYCQPGVSAAISAIDGGVVAGGMDGVLKAFDKRSGEVVWEYDSLRSYRALGGHSAQGGSFGGASGPVFQGNRMFVNSGYGIYYHMPGNALLAFELAE